MQNFPLGLAFVSAMLCTSPERFWWMAHVPLHLWNSQGSHTGGYTYPCPSHVVFAVALRTCCVVFSFQWGINHPLLMLSFSKFPIPWLWATKCFHLLNSTFHQYKVLHSGFLERRPPILMHLHPHHQNLQPLEWAPKLSEWTLSQYP